MVSREPANHSDDCYCSSCSVQDFNLKNKKKISYPNILSGMHPFPNGADSALPSDGDDNDGPLTMTQNLRVIGSKRFGYRLKPSKGFSRVFRVEVEGKTFVAS